MPALHDLAKQVYIQFVFENKQIDLLREAQRLMQPIGSFANDEHILLISLARARSFGKPASDALWSLHGVNSHAENIWRDYYNLHQARFDGLVESYLAAESSSASSSSGSFSDAESLSAASSPPTSVEDPSDAQDKASPRSRLPSEAPEECANSAPPSRATSPGCSATVHLPSPAVSGESCADSMDIIQEEDRASLCGATPDAVESDPVINTPAFDHTASSDNVPAEERPEPVDEPMDEDVVDSEAVTEPPLHSESSSREPSASPSVRYETTSPSSSTYTDESPAPQTPSTILISSPSSSISGSPRRSKRVRKSSKRPDEALKPLSLASSSIASSPPPVEPSITASSPVQSNHVNGRYRYTMVEEMGRAGAGATLGDLKACARFLAEHPNPASLTRDGRGKAFFKIHKQRTWKAWTHIFNRFEPVIADLAETYRASTSS